ncbi:phage portal protein [Brevibacillus fortis]|uniref:phage portal protein n=1 Tax=Brevibacillus fortis TaxID=2126352 RepID=UPI0038FC445C
MNWLERTIATISPEWAYKRKAWRSGMDALYDSGSRGRLNSNWNPAATADENKMRTERNLILSRARDLERNSDVAESIIDAFERNVVGAGMTLQAKVPKTVAGAEEINQRIEKLWKEFSKAENCDITATQSLEEIQEMLVRRHVVDGGILIVKVFTDDKRFPFKLQVREVDELDSLTTSFGGKRVVDGIEINEFGRPLAYHFKKFDGIRQLHGESIRIEADKVIFWRRKTSPRQVRELSRLRTAIPRIKDANQFIEAVSVKERVLACLSVFIKKASPTGSIGRGVNPTGKNTGYDGMSLSPGMIGELNPGDEVQTVIPSGQASNTKDFISTLVRMVGSGIGLSYEAISRDMSNVNYSSARQGLIEDRKTYKRMQRSLIGTVLSPIYLQFLETMFMTGQLDIRDFMQKKEQYSAHLWIPPGSTWIDPMKEVSANRVALESNQDTLARICAERGEDWREVVMQRIEEIKLIQELTGGVASGENNASDGADKKQQPDE